MQPHDTTPTKTCTKCGETKPATAEYFDRCRKNRDGLQYHCKECRGAYRAAHKQRQAEYGRAHYRANKERYAKLARKYATVNKEQLSEYKRTWHAANRERRLEQMREYASANREREAARARKWYAANPEKGKANAHRGRARRHDAEGTYTLADIDAQYERQKGKCYYCNIQVGDDYHIDHVVPLSRGGSNWPENLVIACPSCNLSKHDKLPHEWPQGGRLL